MNIPSRTPELRPSENPQYRSRMSGIVRHVGIVSLAIGGLLVQAGKVDTDGARRAQAATEQFDEAGDLPKNVLERLEENARALQELEGTSLQEVFDVQQARDPILVPTPFGEKEQLCIDERYRREKAGDGLAGVGILLSDSELQHLVEEEIDEAEMALADGAEHYTIKLLPHGKGTCGAARLALAQDGIEEPGSEEVDEKALAGGYRHKEFLDREIHRRTLDDKISVTVELISDEEHFLASPNHPGAIGLHHAHPHLTMNLERETGPLMYNIKSVRDGILAAKIACGAHGMEHGRVPLPTHVFRIVLTGPEEMLLSLQREYETELAKPENENIRSHLKIETWKLR